jgi:hypothetical protein
MFGRRILKTVLLVAVAVVLNGCVVARDITVGMDEKAQEKLADRVAAKVVEKMKKECCCMQADKAACPMTSSCPKMTCPKSAEPNAVK